MKSKRLDPLIKRAEAREEDAARELAEKARLLEANEQRLAELRRYAEEYGPAPAGAAINPALLANRMAFREKVEQAVELQKKAVERSRSQCELQRTRLLLASRDAQVLEKLAASHRAAEQRAQGRKEQKELDDLAARSFLERTKGEGA
jgi:flagellar FliJ protein